MKETEKTCKPAEENVCSHAIRANTVHANFPSLSAHKFYYSKKKKQIAEQICLKTHASDTQHNYGRVYSARGAYRSFISFMNTIFFAAAFFSFNFCRKKYTFFFWLRLANGGVGGQQRNIASH